jgi:aldose sugar dehydrogenase
MGKIVVLMALAGVAGLVAFHNLRPVTLVAGPGYVIDTLATDLVVPWQIVFLPDSTMLFTERPGRVRMYRAGRLYPKPLLEMPNLPLRNKTGMLGMCIHPDFGRNRYVYIAHDYWKGDTMRLRVTRYRLEGDTLLAPFGILENLPANQNHTGCRLVFGPDRKLYVTLGDADEPARAQDLKAFNGKILRLNADGSVPADNPFYHNDTARKEIWSYGHRNCQGLAFEPGTGTLFNTEHGPTGGDEVNIIKKGANYGWPVIHHRETGEGMRSPLAEYTPSIAPGEAMFYKAKAFPQLRGCLLVGCLRGEGILRLQLARDSVVSQEILLKGQYGRIRSLVTGPDGYIYFSTSQIDPVEGTPRPHYDMILRMRPSGSGPGLIAAQKIATDKQAPGATGPKTAAALYTQMCASCHGDHLQGTAKTQNLQAGAFKYGSDQASIVKNITNGIIAQGMPAWNGALKVEDIQRIAHYIKHQQSANKD